MLLVFTLILFALLMYAAYSMYDHWQRSQLDAAMVKIEAEHDTKAFDNSDKTSK